MINSGGGGFAVIWHVQLTKKLKVEEEKRVQQYSKGKRIIKEEKPYL